MQTERRSWTGGQVVVQALRREGIEHAFTVPGESFLEVLDALHDAAIRTVATRHEAGAAFMAEGYGKLTGRPAVCLATRAVGTANMAIGLHTARQDSTPLVAIAGQVPTAFRGREAFQEAELAETFGALCKAAVEVIDPERLAEETQRAVRTARAGRPGPVLLSLPEDVLEARVRSPVFLREEMERPASDAALLGGVDLVLERLAAASSPLILVGGGVRAAGATRDLARLAEMTAIPVVTAWRRRDSFPNDHPSFVGMTGLAAPATVRALVADADLLLVIGSRLSEITTWGYSLPAVTTSVIQVDLEPGFRGDRRQPDVAIAADAGPFLRLAAERQAARDGETQGRRGRQRRVASARAAYLAATALPEWQPSSPVHPAAVVAALRGSLPDDAIITTDAGNFSGWAARYLPLPAEARFLGPTSGAMGYAIPAAIGAAAAGNGRRAVALVGDGGFAMSMAELETAVRIGVPLSVIVFDNGMYGTIRMHQEQAHPGRVSATSLGPIDAAAVARASGAQAWTVAADVDVAPAVDAALASAEVSVVHVLVDPRYLSVDRLL